MKALSFYQPWATIVALGIKDLENRTSFQFKHRGKVLIHSTIKAMTKNFFWDNSKMGIEYISAFECEELMGNISVENDDYLKGYIIGWAELVDVVEGYTGEFWDDGGVYVKLRFENAHIFDTPIKVSGERGLWEYDGFTEDNMPPSHKVELRRPSVKGDELTFPISEISLENVIADNSMMIRDYPCVVDVMIDEKGDLKDFKSIKFVTPSRTVEYELKDVFFYQSQDEKQNIILVNTKFDGRQPDVNLIFELGKQKK